MKKVNSQTQTDKYKKRSKLNKKYFTRERKIGFVSLIAMILNMIRRTSQIEIDEFMKTIINTENKENISYTKQAFSEARQKLSPLAFTMLNDTVISEYYNDDDFKKYKGYRLLASDASILEIPNNPETRQIYGYATNNNPDLKIARAMMAELYDLENGLIVSSKISRYTSSERNLVKENIEKMLSYKHNHIKNLILFDRGYPSLDLMLYLANKEIKFLMRVSNSFLKEVNNAKSNDQDIEILRGKNRIKIRVIRIKLDNGEEEILITNLFQDELSIDEAKELYFKRWMIETKFDSLKNKLQIENFSGEKPIIIEQDFYASVLISNLAALIRNDAEEELIEKNKGKQLKHTYKINENILIGKLKYNLILFILEENDLKKTRMYDEFLKELERNVIPIRKDRCFERKKALRSNRYSQNRRRSL